MRTIRIITALAVTATILVLSPAIASATNQPYGGCDEAWQAPKSAGARWCRSHGWTVTRNLVVSPNRVVKFSRLPHCRFEDGSGQKSACSWNFDGTDGNGIGRAYWLDRKDRTHYVRRPHHATRILHDGEAGLNSCPCPPEAYFTPEQPTPDPVLVPPTS